MPHETFPSEFPVLYHGTSQHSLIPMMEQGLMPRGGTGKDNWKHTVTSNPNTVYLSDCFAHYFAFQAMQNNEGAAALEIDVTKLNRYAFVADEDAVEQASRGHHIPHTPRWLAQSNDMKRRTRWFRDNAELFDPSVSMQLLGTVGYRGTIPWSAVRRVALLTAEQARLLTFLFDPTITTLLYKIRGSSYRRFTRSLFDQDLLADVNDEYHVALTSMGVKAPVQVVGDLEEEHRPKVYAAEDLLSLYRALQSEAANEEKV